MKLIGRDCLTDPGIHLVKRKLRKKTGKLQIRATVCFSTDNLFYVAEMLLLYSKTFVIFCLISNLLDELEVKKEHPVI